MTLHLFSIFPGKFSRVVYIDDAATYNSTMVLDDVPIILDRSRSEERVSSGLAETLRLTEQYMRVRSEERATFCF